MLYLSYNNNNLDFVFRLVTELNRYEIDVWLDRYEIQLTDDWFSKIASAQTEATFAILVLSEEYLNSPYCQDEYKALVSLDIPIIAVVANDIPVTQFTADIQVIDWIDSRAWQETNTLDKTINFIRAHLPETQLIVHQAARNLYINTFIERVELSLTQLPTSRALNQQNEGVRFESVLMRPRGYWFNSLIEEDINFVLDDTAEPIDNLLTFFQSQKQFVLQAAAGSGKSVIVKILGLWSALSASKNNEAPLPILLDLALFKSEQSMDAFLQREWPFEVDWKEWITTHEAFFIFDNWSVFCKSHSSTVIESAISFFESISDHALILAVRDKPTFEIDMPIVRIAPMQNHQVQRFGRLFLNESKVPHYKRMVAQHKFLLERRNIDLVACGIELMVLDTPIALESWFVNPVESLILLRFNHVNEEDSPTFPLEYFIERMKTLAWHMMKRAQTELIHHDRAVKVIGQDGVVEFAAEINLLDVIGDYLRFNAEIFQRFLVTAPLVNDGLYKHISYPQFQDDGQRVPIKWDMIIFALLDSSSPSRKQQLIDQIAEIDPFLAWTCLQHYPDLYETYLRSVIEKLIELRSKNPSSQQAFTTLLQQVPNPRPVALCLIDKISKYGWNVQQWLWIELLRLQIKIPKDFIERLSFVDRNIDNTSEVLVNDYSREDLALYLAYLLNHTNRQIQSNAIWLLGEFKYDFAKIGLFSLLNDSADEVRSEIIAVLSQFADRRVEQHLLMWLVQHLEFSADVGDLLYQNDRLVSGQLLQTLSEEQNVNDALINAIIKHPEESIAIAVGDYMSTVLDQNPLNGYEFNKEDVVKVQKLLQLGMDRLPSESFVRLIEDVQRVLGISAVADESNAKIEKSSLVQRIQSTVDADHNLESQTVKSNPNLDELLQHLASDDWFIRRQATEQLSALDADTALPLIMERVADPEPHVRILALGLLARFPENDVVLPVLINALNDSEYLVLDCVTDILKSYDGVDESQIVSLFETENVQTLASLLEIAGYRKLESSVPKVAKCLSDKRKPWLTDQTLGDIAADVLAQIGTEEAIDRLNQYNMQEEDFIPSTVETEKPKSRAKSYSAFEKMQLALDALRSDNWETAQKSARFLRDFSKKLRGTDNIASINELLCQALDDPNWYVRWTVVEALAWLQLSQSTTDIKPYLNDENWIVQIATIRALVELAAYETASDIGELLFHDNNAVQEAATEALGILKNPAVVPQLEQSTLSHEDDFIRLAGIKSIVQIIGVAQSRDYLVEALNDDYMHIRWFAAHKLIPHLSENDTDILEQLLEDHEKPAWEEMSIHDLAKTALEKLASVANGHTTIDDESMNGQGDVL